MEDLLNTRKTARLITREEIPDIFGIQEHKVVTLAVVESANANDFPVIRTCGFGRISWKACGRVALEEEK